MFSPRRRRGFVTFFCAVVLAVAARADVVINEILYRPGTGYPENTGREFIELHNPTGAPIDVGGWALTSGASYTIPAGTSIGADGFLVIASDPAQVQAAYGIASVLGPWTAGAALSDKGEKITLSKPGATPGSWVKVDDVTYASEGDWATRVRETTYGGWDWSTLAKDAGKSLELRNPLLSNDNGQNWAVSTAAAGATPGAVNSVLSTNVPPIISNVKHFPAVPKSAQNVTISCQLLDEAPAPGLTATVFWRDATSTTPGVFQTAPMTGDGSGSFAAILGPKANLTIVEFYLAASDGVNTRTWPAPTSEGQNANCQYQVDNEVLNAADSYYRLSLTAAENAAFNSVASSSDRQFNQTLVVVRGAETTIRYRSAMRIRGNSSRGYQFKPLRISLPNDDLWDGAAVFNLNPKASFLQFVGNRLFQAAGLRTSDSIPVELRRNGIEATTSTGTTPDYGKWARLEDENGDLVNTHWPLAGGGNLYKKIDNGGPLNYYWRSGQAAPTNPDGLLDGWSKQNNSGANDWSDLRAFFTTWQAAAKPHFNTASTTDVAGSNGTRISGTGTWLTAPVPPATSAFSAAEIASIETVADLDQWARWFAVMTILQDLETKVSNGVDDDYAAYFVPSAGGQRRMQLIAHDLDTIFGLGDNPQPYNYAGLYDATEVGQSGFTFRSLLPLLGTTAVAGNAAFRTKYFTAIRELYGTVFNASTSGNPNPPFYQFLDNHLGGWVPAATLGVMKTFATNRQTYLLGLVGGPAIVPPAATSSATVAGTPGALLISEILANNVAAVNVGGAFPDIIELRNNGATTADLSGMSLTDDPAVKAKFVFPAGTAIPAGGFLTVFADSLATAGLHTGFGLDQDGDTLQLYDSAAAGQALLDTITFGAQPADFSIGRVGLLLTPWALCTPTVGAANTAVAALAAPAGVKINEWFGNPAYQFDEDFLELYNPAAQPVALGGMAVTDDFINYPAQRILPPLTFLAAASFLRMDAKGSSASAASAAELPFKIGSYAGWLALLGQNGTVADRVDLVSQPADTATGRSPDGGVAFARFGLPTTLATPGASNAAPPANILALMNGLRLTELLFAPGNLEYLELQNLGATTLDLSGVRLTKGVTYTFAPGASLAPGAFIVVCKNTAAFQARFGLTVPLAEGNFSGSLSDSGEAIALRLPAPWEPNILNFSYDAGWYPTTSAGFSLSVVNAAATAPGDWNLKTTWLASTTLYGTPGSDGPPTITSSLNASTIIGDVFSYQITASKFPSSYAATPLPPGLSVDAATGLLSGTSAGSGVFNVSISATNAAGTDTKTLALTIAASGPLATFAWGAVASAQQAGVPFAATLTARDAQGRTVVNYNSPVNFSAGVGRAPATTGTGTTPWNYPLGTFYHDARTQCIYLASEIGAAGKITALALDVSTLPGQVMNVWTIRMKHTALASFATAAWESTGWTTVFQANTSITTTGLRNFVFSTPFDFNGTGNVMVDFCFNNTSYTTDGATLSTTTSAARSLYYQTDSGWGDPLTWNGTDAPPPDAIARVPNLKLTFQFTNVTMSPLSGSGFVNGVWAGNVTVSQTAAGIGLRADDGANHTAASSSFNVATPPAPVIISPAGALAVFGQPFGYQIRANNFVASFNAANLPAGLSVNAATGLVSGTPSAAGTSAVALSASNFGGTGNATLSLEVQADADGDGMGDAWETAHGLNPADAADAAADLDGDGQSNRAEWLAGTAPDDAAARLLILSEQAVGADVQIVWTSVIGRRYRVLQRTDLVAAAWSEITPAPIVATGLTTSFTHPGGAAGSARFYRVEVVP